MFRGYFINNQNKITPLPQPSFILLIPFFWLSASGSWEGMARMSSAALQGLALWRAVGPRNQLTPLALQPLTPLSSWAVLTPCVSLSSPDTRTAPGPSPLEQAIPVFRRVSCISAHLQIFLPEPHRLTPPDCFFPPAPRTACPHFVLCLTHICVVLMSPVGKPWCEPPPFFPLMTMPAASSPCLRLHSFPLQPFLFCVWNLLLVNVLSSFSSLLLFFFCLLWMSWDALAPYLLGLLTSGGESTRRQDNRLFPLSRHTSAGISPSFPITSLTLFLSFSHPVCNPCFPVFLAILELLEYKLTCRTHSLNICWVKANESVLITTTWVVDIWSSFSSW